MKKTVFEIIGMHCTSCAMTIDLDLEELDGVRQSKTSYASAKTVVEYDPAKVTPRQIISTIAKSGYEAVV